MQEEWEIFVSRIVKLAVPQITPGEARQIIYFLAAEYGDRSAEAGPRSTSPVKC